MDLLKIVVKGEWGNTERCEKGLLRKGIVLLKDAHVHIDFYDNPGKIIREIMKNDISAIFVTHLPELYEKQKAII